MKLSELLLCSIEKTRINADKRRGFTLIIICVICVFYLCNLCSENETVISLDEPSPQQVQKVEQTKDTKKEINNLYKSAERYRKNKKLLFAVEKYKEALEKDPYHKKSRERLSNMYTEIKYKVDEKILYKSEEVYYAQSVLYFINNDLTASIREWGKCLAITPTNEEVRKFFNKTKGQLAEEYQRQKQEEKEAKIKKLHEEGVELFNSAKYDEAAEKFQAVINLNPGHVSATFYLEQIEDVRNAAAGKEVKKRSRKKKASGKEPEAISIDYEKAEDLYNQGLREYAAGHLIEAIDLWKKCLKYNPSHEKAPVNIEKAKSSLGKE
ncbi:MAG TPA: hypothetical protein DCX95_07320 [Elusimicrobia bacterium]|nr:hypothetical protein [Elusimicrobiota bacterium]